MRGWAAFDKDIGFCRGRMQSHRKSNEKRAGKDGKDRMRQYGYCRVSTGKQNIERQVGIYRRHIRRPSLSGRLIQAPSSREGKNWKSFWRRCSRGIPSSLIP